MCTYAGIDLHSNNSFISFINDEGKRLHEIKVPNNSDFILSTLAQFAESLVGIVVESTYNWYWLVDLLMDNGFTTHLANPTAIQRYNGMKYATDRHDAFWLAEMLRLKILPEGFIYPKEQRPLRDLTRTRSFWVRIRSAAIIRLKNHILRSTGLRICTSRIKSLKEDHVTPYLPPNDLNLLLDAQTAKTQIDSLTKSIRLLEKTIEKQAIKMDGYRLLKTIPGVGKVLALTIFLETGPIGRFAKVGNYASYCRKVPTSWSSNGKRKGQGNKKNGNKHLSWAFAEAASCAKRIESPARRYYDRKLARSNASVAHAALSHKLARAAFYIMRDNVEFDMRKAFG